MHYYWSQVLTYASPMKFDKRFGLFSLGLNYQLNFPSAFENSGEFLRQWSDGVLCGAFCIRYAADVNSYTLSYFCYMYDIEDREADLYVLNGLPKTGS